MCGDRVSVYVRMEDGKVAEARFTGNGCAISKASASLMTEAVTGHTTEDVPRLFSTFQEMVTGKSEPDEDEDRQARRVVWRVGVPVAREVRHAGMARPRRPRSRAPTRR